jgi:sterol desaturase/sphingolipid hydroxylase (fatty acid hydroxylase superfamily)
MEVFEPRFLIITRMNALIENFSHVFSQAQQWLFESVVQPFMYETGMGGLLEDGFTATGWFLVGLVQIALLLLIVAPLQKIRPVETITDPVTVRTDVVYTLIHRLGLFRLALFFTVDPLVDSGIGIVRVVGLETFHLDQWVLDRVGVESALLGFFVYLVVFDAVDYWIHRAQHGLNWWWQLHSLHHAQRQMTMWSDNRNHLLDDVLRDAIWVSLGLLLGIAPGQFVALVALTQLSESFQHANLKLWFGSVGERLWVSPRFHRLHHAIGIGHESPHRLRGGHNFGVLLPWWDMLFRTANFENRFDPTGVRDQIEQGRNYGKGFLEQQWLGLMRLLGRA